MKTRSRSFLIVTLVCASLLLPLAALGSCARQADPCITKPELPTSDEVDAYNALSVNDFTKAYTLLQTSAEARMKCADQTNGTTQYYHLGFEAHDLLGQILASIALNPGQKSDDANLLDTAIDAWRRMPTDIDEPDALQRLRSMDASSIRSVSRVLGMQEQLP